MFTKIRGDQLFFSRRIALVGLAFFFCIFRVQAIVQKPIVLVIPSYNNAAWCIQNIESVLSQEYTNYRVEYIDDCSTDNTYDLIVNKVEELHAGDRVHIVRNTARRGALANIYAAVHRCEPHEIIALVDGDDWLAHEHVLATVNNAYQDPNIWLTYGQFKVHPDERVGECKDIPKGISGGNYYREYPWCTSHLRTFYAGLFQQIKLQDLIFNGNFFQVTWDMAILFPMLEMSGGRFTCIKDVLYIYNCANDANDFKTNLLLQIHCNKLISSKQKYAPLSGSPLKSSLISGVSLLMMSNDNPAALTDFLTSLTMYARGLSEVRIVYCASSPEMENAYQNIQKEFDPSITFERCSPASFKATILKQLSICGEYIALAHDGVMLKETIECDTCARALQKTGAVGFYCDLGKNIVRHPGLERFQKQPPLIEVEPNIYAWQFCDGEYNWRRPLASAMSIYKTSFIFDYCADAGYDSWQTLNQTFLLARVDLHSLGLMHAASSVR